LRHAAATAVPDLVNLAFVFPKMRIPGLFEMRTVDVMTPFVATLSVWT